MALWNEASSTIPMGPYAGGGGLGAKVVYSTSIPLTGIFSYMPDVSLTAATTFSVSGTPVPGSQCKVGLVGDGNSGHVPSFTGMSIDPLGDLYNSTANRLNNCYFWNDGFRTWVTLRDTGLTVTPSASAVTLSGPTTGVISLASTDFTVGANGALASPVLTTPSDSGGGGTFTPSSVSISSGSPTATFTYTPSTTGTKNITITNNAGLANPSNINYAVTSTNWLRYNSATAVDVTESGDGLNGYGYVPRDDGSGWPNSLMMFGSTPKLPVGAWVAVQTQNTSDSGIIGVTESTVPVSYGETLAMAWESVGQLIYGTDGGNVAVGPAITQGDLYRLRRPTGTSLVLETSTDNGTTWSNTPVHTWTIPDVVLYVTCCMNNTTPSIASIYKPRHVGMTA